MASLAARLIGHLRLVHPFPSALDGVVAGVAASLAGGSPETALRLGCSMILLQASVGSLNDVVDAPRDAGRKPGKPIPAGLVDPRVALVLAGITGLAGLGLAVPSGVATVALAVVLLGLGYVYDLWLKGTAWSWLPFAVAIPLFPTYGWLGAAGALPAIWSVVLAAAALAGAALAIGNGIVDIERDLDAGLVSAATRLGRPRAVALDVALLVAAAMPPLVELAMRAILVPWGVAVLAGLGVALAGAALLVSEEPSSRERGWQLQAVGVALAAVAWLAGLAASGAAA